jgi:hypothetical protein
LTTCCVMDRYFVRGAAPWAAFRNWAFESGSFLSLLTALKAVATHAFPSAFSVSGSDSQATPAPAPAVMIGVDELLKCPEYEKLLRAVGACLDSRLGYGVHCYAVVTSLNQLAVRPEVTAASRSIAWILLPTHTRQFARNEQVVRRVQMLAKRECAFALNVRPASSAGFTISNGSLSRSTTLLCSELEDDAIL